MTSTGPDGQRRRRARRGQGGELRERIVDTAATLLAESGDEQAVSIRSVADAVGVTPPSLYLHFPDKSALLRAVVERLFSDLERDVARSQAGSGGPVERVLALARAYLAFGLGSPGRYKVLYEGRVLPALDLPDGGVPGRALIEAAAGDLQEAVQGGQHLPAGDARATTILLWQLLHGAVSLRINKPGFPWRDAWADVGPAVRTLVGVPGQG